MKSILLFFTLSFFVPLSALTWTATQDLSDPNNDASIPQVGIDGPGNGIVSWSSKTSAGPTVVKASIKSSGTWPSPSDLFSSAGYMVTDPVMSVNSLGNAIILSAFSVNGNRLVKACVLSSGTWQEVDTISESGMDCLYHAISMNDSNNGLAVWSSSGSGTWKTLVSKYDPGTTTWSTPEIIYSSTEIKYTPLCFLDSSGDGVVTWANMINGFFSVQASELNSGTFSTPSIISAVDESTEYSALAGNSSGVAVATWTTIARPGRNTAANIYSSNTWGTPGIISELDRIDESPQVAMNSSGDAIVVFGRRDRTRVEIRGVQLTSGTWSSYTTLSDPNCNSSVPQVAIDDSGNAVAIWKSADAAGDLIYAASYTPGGGWTAQELISDSSGTFDNPKVAINAAGNILVAWQKYLAPLSVRNNKGIQIRESSF